jgi:hypothetical protein
VRSLRITPLTSRILFALAVALPGARSLTAQSGGHHPFPISYADSAPDWMWRRHEPTGCFATIPASRMHNTPVYLDADMMPLTDAAFTLQAALMAQDVAAELRALVDSTHSAMPNADGMLAWYTVPAQIVVTVHGDGTETWRVKSVEGDSSAARMLGAAFDSAQAHGSARILLPEGARADSMLVRLSLTPKYQGYQEEIPAHARRGMKFGVFYLSEPDVTPAVPKRNWRAPKYPSENESRRVGGNLLMQFVVDSTGRTVPNSYRDLRPENRPPLAASEIDAHNAFVRSVNAWYTTITFEPMRLGGCPVKQMVELPLEFAPPGGR